MPDTCEHIFVFIRQDKKNIGFDRNPIHVVEDVFFCSKCLEYKRKSVEKQTPKNDGGYYIERLV